MCDGCLPTDVRQPRSLLFTWRATYGSAELRTFTRGAAILGVVHPLRLMADYECYPLWGSQDGSHNVNPFDLPIPGDLVNALLQWSDEYEATLNRSDPQKSGFADIAWAQAWLQAGAVLATRLREQGLDVDYVHQGQKAVELVAVTWRGYCGISGHAAISAWRALALHHEPVQEPI